MNRANQPWGLKIAGALCLAACSASCPRTSAQAVPTPQTPASAPAKRTEAPRKDPARAEELYLAGARMLDHEDFAGAQASFARAVQLNPDKREYSMAFTMTRDHRVNDLVQQAAKARLSGQSKQADALLAQAGSLDPTNEQVLERIPVQDPQYSSLSHGAKAFVLPGKGPNLLGPIHLEPAAAVHDIDLRGSGPQVVTQVAQLYGIKATIDSSDPGTGRPVHFQLQGVTYDQAMRLLLKMTHLFVVPLDAHQILVAKDDIENRHRLERVLEESIYVPGSTVEQLNEFTNIIKNVFEVKQITVGQGSGTILVRASEPTLKALNATLEDLIDGASEVVLDVKLIAVDKLSTVNTGTQTPTSVGAFSVYGEASSIVSANQSLIQQLISSGGYVPTGNVRTDTLIEALYLVLSGVVQDAKLSGLVALAGNGLTLTGIYLGSGATINLGLNTSDTRALDDVTIRVGDRQTATLKIGQKYPITTATYSSGISSATTSALAGVTVNGVSASSLLNQLSNSTATIPQVEFEDLGLILKVVPTVLKSGLVNMNVDLQIQSLTGSSSNNIPILTSRAFTSDLTVADGMSAVMLSDLSKTESSSISGLPGLADLPGFSQTAADTLTTRDESELVLLVTPHVVRHRKSLTASQRVPFESSTPAED